MREPAAEAYAKLKHTLGAQSIPMVRTDDQFGASILLVPESIEKTALAKHDRRWVNGLLFALTVVTTTWAGAAHQGVKLLLEPERFAVGLPYAVGLLLILGVHEMGHYLMARYHGIKVTLPYFIPVPITLGTFGAFIDSVCRGGDGQWTCLSNCRRCPGAGTDLLSSARGIEDQG